MSPSVPVGWAGGREGRCGIPEGGITNIAVEEGTHVVIPGEERRCLL